MKKYKAKFVVRGFSQVEGIDYDKSFAPVARYTFYQGIDLHCNGNGLEDPLDGCEDRFS